MNVLLNLAKLKDKIENGEYHTKRCSEFMLRERGKERAVRGNTFEDKVERHYLVDNLLMPDISPYLAYDNYASQKGKGTSLARKRFRKFMRGYINEHGHNGYILIVDFSKYYDNINHEKLISMIEKCVDDPTALYLVKEAIHSMEVDVSYMTDEEYTNCYSSIFSSLDYDKIPNFKKTGEKIMKKSLSIGDQASQIFSIFYATPIDNYIHNVEGISSSGRYMDDTFVIHESKEKLQHVLEGITKICNELGIHINKKKTRIHKLTDKFHFLQNSYYVTKSDVLIEHIRKEKVYAERRRLKKTFRKVSTGEMTFEKAENMYLSWMGAYSKYMTSEQRKNMIALHDELVRCHAEDNYEQIHNHTLRRH